MPAIDFPSSPPIDCVGTAISMMRDGSWKTQRRTFGQQLYTIEGYGVGLVLHDDNEAEETKTLRNSIARSMNTNDADDFYNRLCDVHDELLPLDPQSGSTRRAATRFNPANILALIQAVLAILGKTGVL